MSKIGRWSFKGQLFKEEAFISKFSERFLFTFHRPRNEFTFVASCALLSINGIFCVLRILQAPWSCIVNVIPIFGKYTTFLQKQCCLCFLGKRCYMFNIINVIRGRLREHDNMGKVYHCKKAKLQLRAEHPLLAEACLHHSEVRIASLQRWNSHGKRYRRFCLCLRSKPHVSSTLWSLRPLRGLRLHGVKGYVFAYVRLRRHLTLSQRSVWDSWRKTEESRLSMMKTQLPLPIWSERVQSLLQWAPFLSQNFQNLVFWDLRGIVLNKLEFEPAWMTQFNALHFQFRGSDRRKLIQSRTSCL